MFTFTVCVVFRGMKKRERERDEHKGWKEEEGNGKGRVIQIEWEEAESGGKAGERGRGGEEKRQIFTSLCIHR